jgi:hypothetical protein
LCKDNRKNIRIAKSDERNANIYANEALNTNNPIIAKSIANTLIVKNNRVDIRLSKYDPSKHHPVRNMKYKLVAKAASSIVIPRRSIKIFGAVVFVPTSIPT